MHSWFSSPALRFRALLIFLILVVFLIIIIVAWTALIPFLLGLLFAYLLLPVVNYLDGHAPRLLRDRGWSRPIAIIIVYVVLVAFIGGIISYFVPVIGSQAKTLVSTVPGYLERVQNLMQYDVNDLLQGIPPEIRDTVYANLERAGGSILTAIQRGLVVTISTVSQTISFLIGLVIIPFWLFYVLNDAAKAQRAFYDLVPEGVREDVRCIGIIVDALLSAYVRGQFLLCVIVGVMATIVLFVFHVNLALLLGTVAGILEIIPILGPYLGAVPAILVALADRPITALWVALSFAGIQQIENIFLVPRISGNAVRFHPAVVMVIVIIGSEVAGLLGILLAVPLAAMLRDVFHYLYLRTTESGATPQMALERVRPARGRSSD